MPTLSCPEAPPCTLVLLTVCRRRSPLWPLPTSRSLLHQRESTLYGLEDPSLHPFPPSSRCGSPNRSTMSAVHPLSTGSASKFPSIDVAEHSNIHTENRLLGIKERDIKI